MKNKSYVFAFIFAALALSAHAQTDLCQKKHQYADDEIQYSFSSPQKTQLRFFRPQSHRSKPNDEITVANNTYIAWGDLGLVKYSLKHQQVIDEVPLDQLIGPDFRGELLALDYHDKDHQLLILVFNDHKLRFEKIHYCLSQKKALTSIQCPS